MRRLKTINAACKGAGYELVRPRIQLVRDRTSTESATEPNRQLERGVHPDPGGSFIIYSVRWIRTASSWKFLSRPLDIQKP